MKPETISAIAAAISAFSALMTTYFYRKQGKGFLWTKDPALHLNEISQDNFHLAAEIPILNLGSGNIRFNKLRAKKVYLKNNSVELFEMDMDEAYFPTGSLVVLFRTPIFSDEQTAPNSKLSTQIRIHRIDVDRLKNMDTDQEQIKINSKLEGYGEVLLIMKCDYKDGSWFGLWTTTTTIALSIKGMEISFLSSARRKELDNLFS